MGIHFSFNSTAIKDPGWVKFSDLGGEAPGDPSVRKPVAFDVAYDDIGKTSPEIAEQRLNSALFIASQSDTGRDTLQQAKDAGYSIVVDAQRCEERAANAFCDHMNKQLVVANDRDSMKQALNLVHEAGHALQIDKAGLKVDRTQTPETQLKVLMSIEADARALEIQTAFEIAFGHQDGPEDQLKLPAILETAQYKMQSLPGIADIIEKGKDNPEDVHSGRIMAEVFQAFYGAGNLREYYERSVMGANEGMGEDEIKKTTNLRQAWTSSQILSKFREGGVRYIQEHVNDMMSVDEPFYIAVSSKTASRIERLQQLRKQEPANQNETDWQLPVYETARTLFNMMQETQQKQKGETGKTTRPGATTGPKTPVR